MAPIRRNRKDVTPQMEGAASLGHADRLVQETVEHRSEQDSTELGLEHVSDISLLDHSKPCLPGKLYNVNESLVLNGASSLNTFEKNPSLRPSKRLEDVQYEGASACDATTGPVMESEAMRKWKEIKQNGFLSHPHGGMPTQPQEPVKKKRVRRSGAPLDAHGSIPMPPLQHGKGSSLPGGMLMSPAQHSEGSSLFLRPPGIMPPPLQVKGSNFLSHPQRGIVVSPQPSGKKHDVKQSKRKEPDLERNTETTKREHANKFKSAPPSGLLSGLNIGVIRRIRNQKEVVAILEAMMQPEKTNARMESAFIIQLGSGNGENEDTTKDKVQFTQGISRASILPVSEQEGERIALDHADERSHPQNSTASPTFPATCKSLASAVTTSSDIASGPYGVNSSAEQAPHLSLSSEWRGEALGSHDSAKNILCESSTGSLSMLDHNKNLPLAVITTPSEIVTKACGSNISMEQENIFSLSKKGLS